MPMWCGRDNKEKLTARVRRPGRERKMYPVLCTETTAEGTLPLSLAHCSAHSKFVDCAPKSNFFPVQTKETVT